MQLHRQYCKKSLIAQQCKDKKIASGSASRGRGSCTVQTLQEIDISMNSENNLENEINTGYVFKLS